MSTTASPRSADSHQTAGVPTSDPAVGQPGTYYGRAALAGLAAGSVMSMAMMGVAALLGDSVWTMPNLIAAMWLGPSVVTGAFGWPTVAGFVTHEATSALMGVVAVPFVAGLRGGRIQLVSLAYALASYPLVFSLVMRWANPTMYERAPMFQMTWAHLLYGAVFGLAYARWARPRAER